MDIGGKTVGESLLIIAEGGSTHKGDVEKALICIDAAIEAGADAWKGIMSDADALIADRSIQYGGQSLYDVIKSYQLSDDDWRTIGTYCKERNFPFYVSVGTANYVNLAVEVGSCCLKAGGWDIRNYPLFDAFIETGLPIQIDIGCVIYGEVANLLNYIRERADVEVSLLYESHSSNPKEVNLLSIPYLKEKFGVAVGYSANEYNPTPDYMALALGAEIIEKRLKPDDTPGHHRDKALNPNEFKEYVKALRALEKDAKHMETFNSWQPDYLGVIPEHLWDGDYLGKYGLYPSLADVSQKNLWFTSLTWTRDVKRGEAVTEDMLCAKRPGNGLSPIYDYLWLGKPLARDVRKDAVVVFNDV